MPVLRGGNVGPAAAADRRLAAVVGEGEGALPVVGELGDGAGAHFAGVQVEEFHAAVKVAAFSLTAHHQQGGQI